MITLFAWLFGALLGGTIGFVASKRDSERLMRRLGILPPSNGVPQPVADPKPARPVDRVAIDRRVVDIREGIQRREIAAARADARAAVFAELLPVVDSFERARDANDLSEGATLAVRALEAALERCEVAAIEVDEDARFDPRWHEAVAATTGPRDEAAMRVIQVVRRGYRDASTGRLLRPALVVVQARPAESVS